MRLLLFFSDLLIPLLIFYIVGFGLLMKRNVYNAFVRGAREGLLTVYRIVPTLIGLMVAVGMLRAGGFLELVSAALGRLLSRTGFPAELVPLAVVKLFSSSAATGLLLDIFRECGADSRNGQIASVMLSCTETIFYTMSIYFMAVKVKRTRYTLAGALLVTLVGISLSVWLGSRM